MELNAENVDKIFMECLHDPGENADGAPIAEAIKLRVCFNPIRLKANEGSIRELLNFIHPNFHKSKGGGWTFLNFCLDRDGDTWTGLHQIMDKLLALGLATEMITFTMSREMWSALPEGMPFLTIDTINE